MDPTFEDVCRILELDADALRPRVNRHVAPDSVSSWFKWSEQPEGHEYWRKLCLVMAEIYWEQKKCHITKEGKRYVVTNR